MYILTIVRCDVIFGEIEIFMPIKAPTRSMCETIYVIENVVYKSEFEKLRRNLRKGI